MGSLEPSLDQLGPNLYRNRDTANSYVIRSDRSATCVDIGDGSVLDRLPELGVDAVTDVVMTHHHRDVAQGLHRAVAAGARVWVPPVERELFDGIDEYWQARPLDNYYDVRDDRFSLFESVEIAGTVAEYRSRHYGNVDLRAIPTPGHTTGSVSYLAQVDGVLQAFTGDLIRAAGKIHSLAATQWAYNGLNGVVAGILSGLDLLDYAPTVLLPAHGEPITDPPAAIGLLNGRLQALLNLRIPEWQISDLRASPFVQISPHLWWNATGLTNSYALLSDDGVALIIDFGYDFGPFIPGFDMLLTTARSSRRPWLQTVPALKRLSGIDRIEVALPSHYHDDHVAGFTLLREIEGTKVWSPANMTRIFREPRRFDLPCLWYDPIEVDRELDFGRPVRWHEYEITAHELPGHTRYAAAYEFVVDGRTVLATGDQQDFGFTTGDREFRGFSYKGGFQIDDYVTSAALYRRIAPDLMVSGHWPPYGVATGYFEANLEEGRELARLHRQLLPLDEVDFGAEGVAARIEPYRSEVTAGEAVELEVEVRNPFGRPQTGLLRLVVPTGWTVEPPERALALPANDIARVEFTVRPSGDRPVRRARVGADVTVAGVRFGLAAEALVTVTTAAQVRGDP